MSERSDVVRGGPGKCPMCDQVFGFLYNGKCAVCEISGALYAHKKRCTFCGVYEGGEHVARMHDAPPVRGK